MESRKRTVRRNAREHWTNARERGQTCDRERTASACWLTTRHRKHVAQPTPTTTHSPLERNIVRATGAATRSSLRTSPSWRDRYR